MHDFSCRSSWSVILAISALTLAALANDYAPVQTMCPSQPLLRAASGLNDDEATYRISRKVVADEALTTQHTKTAIDFDITGITLPTVKLRLAPSHEF